MKNRRKRSRILGFLFVTTACTHTPMREPAALRPAKVDDLRAHNCAQTPPSNVEADPYFQSLELSFYEAHKKDFGDLPAIPKIPVDGGLQQKLREIDRGLTGYIKEGAADWAAMYTRADTCGLDSAERFAILDYGQGPYNLLNKSLREQTSEQLGWGPFVAVLDAALAKLRPYRGIVRRGVHFTEEQIAEYQAGRTVTWLAYSSASLGKAFPGNVQFIIRTVTGRFISPLSSTPLEDEVLLPRQTTLKVLKHTTLPDGTHQIWLEEIGA